LQSKILQVFFQKKLAHEIPFHVGAYQRSRKLAEWV